MKNALIILPTYNERENIERLIHTIRSKVCGAEILVVDDNSSDGTAEAVGNIAKASSDVHLITRREKGGLGTAYIAGFQFAIENGAEYIVTMDADFSHDPKYIIQLLDLGKQYDIVIASRYIENSSTKAWSLQRRLLSIVGNWYIRMITRLPVKDCTSGFKCYRVNALQEFNFASIKARHFIFQVEIIYRLLKRGCAFIEVPYVFTERTKGRSKISLGVLFEAAWIPLRIAFLCRNLFSGKNKRRELF